MLPEICLLDFLLAMLLLKDVACSFDGIIFLHVACFVGVDFGRSVLLHYVFIIERFVFLINFYGLRMVEYDLVAGHWGAVSASLAGKVSLYQRGKKKFKIGITVDPERRWGKHSRSHHGWDRMIVLYETTSHDYVCKAESSLIVFSSEKYDEKCQNKIGGGGGVNEPGRHDKFYLYMLVKK
ncbi:hypothetical protein [Chromobacterium violaceum]|uniref:hypothetical protein n=1 Tax=Chromobacterium violaceum TaxID=536 RepID=UPI001CE0D1BA|nr:hypothetical protein [Chromobacterium violaceum]